MGYILMDEMSERELRAKSYSRKAERRRRDKRNHRHTAWWAVTSAVTFLLWMYLLCLLVGCLGVS